jgi:hypothetical protein
VSSSGSSFDFLSSMMLYDQFSSRATSTRPEYLGS